MIRIGGVSIDVSHPLAFSEYLQKDNRARYVAVYNDGFREDDEVEGFIKNFNLEKRCNSIEELADMVDIGFVQSCNWDNHIKQAMPFIERGKPVFIDKPIVGTLADCRKLKDLVSAGAVIIGSSSLRYCNEVVAFNNQPEEERGKIMLAGRISRENGGAEIKLTDIPADDPGYDGNKFEKEYAAAATKMYV